MPEMTSLEIRLLTQQGTAYPIEMTLAGTQQVFHGQLTVDIAAWIPGDDSRVDGQALFKALFASTDLMRGWGVAHGRSKRVRVQLRIDAPELHALPWELLRDDQDLLAADADSPFSRYLAVSREWGQVITVQPIRVLTAISDPKDIKEKYGLPSADVEREIQALKEALGAAAELTVLPSPVTLDRLETELRKGYHILHFVGHGTFNSKAQQAALFLQDASGNVQRVIDDDFAGMLNRLASPPHLVVLAACRSAQQSMKAAFSGLGPKLVQIGVPAVIAMQENMTVLSARQFAATFYQRLLAHGVVDLAMNEARGTLITKGRFDAGVPVLFMRLPDGRLWNTRKPAPLPNPRHRLLDAAIPSKVQVAIPAELLVLIRMPHSDGLKAWLNIEQHEAQPEDVHTRELRLSFPTDAEGRIRPALISIALESTDFDILERRKKVEVPVDGDSDPCTFLITPRRVGKLKILVQATSERQIQLGSAMLNAESSGSTDEVTKYNLITLLLHTQSVQIQMETGRELGQSRSGGADLNAGGAIIIGGDVVGREKIIHTDQIDTSGGAAVKGNVVVESGGELVGRDKKVVFQEPPRPIVQALNQLPPPIADFVGRDPEIAELTQQLHKKHNVIVICGMGGAGKTALALLVANDLRVDFPDAQLFVELHGSDITPRNSADVLTACIRAFVGQEVKLPGVVDDLTAIYRSNLSGKHALIVLDDAVDEAQVQPLLPPTGCVLLITSRQKLTLPDTIHIALNEFSPNEARQLLVSLAPRTARRLPVPLMDIPAAEAHALLARRLTPELADQICYLCGDLPLAIRAAGSLLNVNRAIDPVEYIKQLRSERTRLGRIGMVGNNLSVEACFSSSYMHLPLEAARVFRFLAVFPTWFDAAIEEVVCEDEAQTQLNNLVKHSLVECNPDSGRYRLHDLVRVFIAKRIKPAEQVLAGNNIIKSLKAKAHRYERAMFYGECLLEPQWSLKSIRTAVLRALRGLMVDAQLVQADRRKIARLLTRLRWLDKRRVPPDQMIVYLELIAPYVDTSFECRYLKQHITAMLESTSVTLSKRQWAQLLVYRAAMLGQLGELDEAIKDYAEADAIADKLVESGDCLPEDLRLTARIKIGHANPIVIRYEQAAELEEQPRHQDELRIAVNLYRQAIELAQTYGRDAVLELTGHIQLIYAYALSQNWEAGEQTCKDAFAVLQRIENRQDQVLYRARTLEIKSELHMRKGQSTIPPNSLSALHEYEIAYRSTQDEIDLLEHSSNGSFDLVLAHNNAGEYLLAMSNCPDCKEPQILTNACGHWQTALEMAHRLDFVDLARDASTYLEQRCASSQE
jgi:hypothetical protein